MIELIFEQDGYTIHILNASPFLGRPCYAISNYRHSYGNSEKYLPSSMHGIRVLKGDVEISSAMLVGFAGPSNVHDKAIILEESRLLMCISNRITCMSFPELELIWDEELDDATCFEIFRYRDDYIIHGELDISRVDKNGKIKWKAGGRDIFTEGFVIKDNTIEANDFNKDTYIFEIETGKLISSSIK